MDTQYVLVDIDNPPAELHLKVGHMLALYRFTGAGAPRLCNLLVPSEHFAARQPRFGETVPGQPERTFIVSLYDATASGSGLVSMQFAAPELFGEPGEPRVLQYGVED